MVLGFGLGGFFDGILLHQILQWHHLLSLVPGAGDLRWQVLWDGVFHALMYVVAALGLWGLWWARRRGDEAPGRRLVGALMVGFGLWHVVDSILSHWALGIHRIRIDSPNPLAWDLVWFVAFGVVPLVLGGWLVRGGGQGPALREAGGRGSTQVLAGGRGATAGPAGGPNRRHAALPLVVLTVATVGAAAWSLVPPPGALFTTIVFRPDVAPGRSLRRPRRPRRPPRLGGRRDGRRRRRGGAGATLALLRPGRAFGRRLRLARRLLRLEPGVSGRWLRRRGRGPGGGERVAPGQG